MPIQVGYRAVTAKDFEWLLSLRKVTMDPHLRASGLEPNESAHIDAVRTDYDWTQIAVHEGQDIGMIRAVRLLPDWHLRNIQIVPEFQRQNLGTLLMEELLRDAADVSATVVLNLLNVNPAKHLYERLGFKIIGYGEDSVKMRWDA